MEVLQRVHLFADAEQLDRLARTARIDSAAPPRPSPSTRVSTMPVTPTRSLKFLARLTASWPVSASATSRISCGLAASRISAISAISGSSMWVRPAVSSSTTS